MPSICLKSLKSLMTDYSLSMNLQYTYWVNKNRKTNVWYDNLYLLQFDRSLMFEVFMIILLLLQLEIKRKKRLGTHIKGILFLCSTRNYLWIALIMLFYYLGRYSGRNTRKTGRSDINGEISPSPSQVLCTGWSCK